MYYRGFVVSARECCYHPTVMDHLQYLLVASMIVCLPIGDEIFCRNNAIVYVEPFLVLKLFLPCRILDDPTPLRSSLLLLLLRSRRRVS